MTAESIHSFSMSKGPVFGLRCLFLTLSERLLPCFGLAGGFVSDHNPHRILPKSTFLILQLPNSVRQHADITRNSTDLPLRGGREGLGFLRKAPGLQDRLVFI